MKRSAYPAAVFSVIAAACLLLGYILAGKLWILAVLAGVVLLWIIIRRSSAAAGTLLLIYVVLAMGGILMKAAAAPMVVGVTAALAAWDAFSLPPGSQNAAHGRSLAAFLVVAPVLAMLGLQLDLRLPFGALLFLALLCIGSLTYAIRRLLKSG